jgi:hypothetical protein
VASLQRKIKDGRPYWYVVETAWINGKPRVLRQRYLGTVASIEAAFDAALSPEQVEQVEFGALCGHVDASLPAGDRRGRRRGGAKRRQGCQWGPIWRRPRSTGLSRHARNAPLVAGMSAACCPGWSQPRQRRGPVSGFEMLWTASTPTGWARSSRRSSPG